MTEQRYQLPAPARSEPSQLGPAAGDREPDELFARLQELSGGRLASLTLTANRSSILSYRPAAADPRALELRLHGCFLGADDATLEHVAALAKPRLPSLLRGRAQAIVRAFFAERASPPPPRRRQPRSDPRGRWYDLGPLFTRLEAEHFKAPIDVQVSWGKALPTRRSRRRTLRRVIRLGSYDATTRFIRIHRILDREDVPEFVVAAVLFHEMLHATDPATHELGTRRCLHGAEFRRRERAFPDHEAAQDWLRLHLDALFARRDRQR